MTGAPSPTMTPDRWRKVDQILQGAFAQSTAQRDEFVAAACGDDAGLRAEVSSLLLVHDATPAAFLERPAIEEHGTPPSESRRLPDSPPQARRMVPARVLVYATAAGIIAGSVTGWSVARSTMAERWRGTLKAIQQQARANAETQPGTASMDRVTGANGQGTLVVLDRGGRVVRQIGANRPGTPRFSPDGRRIAYSAVGAERSTSDIWITDLDGPTRRLTNDADESSDPQWSPDGGSIAYAANGPDGRHIAEQWATGGGLHGLPAPPGTQFATDRLRDGSALLVSVKGERSRYDVLVQPMDGSEARAYAATPSNESPARISPHSAWVAYTSNESGRDEVYVDSYPRPGYRIMLSSGGGTDPAWRSDGNEIFYWRADTLVALAINGSRRNRPPILGGERVLFHLAHERSLHSMYDVSPDGSRIVVVRRP